MHYKVLKYKYSSFFYQKYFGTWHETRHNIKRQRIVGLHPVLLHSRHKYGWSKRDITRHLRSGSSDFRIDE